MKKFFFILFLPSFFLGQNKTIDSLKLILQNAKHDTTRCNSLVLLIQNESDVTVWPIYNEQLKKLAEKNCSAQGKYKKVFLKHLAFSILNYGDLNIEQGNLEQALDNYKKGIKIREEIGDKKDLASAYNNCAQIYYLKGNFTLAIEFVSKSLKISESIGDKKEMANCLDNLGNIYDMIGKKDTALAYYYKSLNVSEDSKDKSGQALALNNMAVTYQDLGNIAKCLESHFKCLKLREETGEKNYIAISLNNIGLVYINQGNLIKALDYYYRALKILEGCKDKGGMAVTLSNIGVLYKTQRDFEKALEHLQKSLKLLEEINDKFEIGNVLNNIGSLYQDKADLKNAIQYHQKALAIREEINDTKGISGSYNNLGVIYKDLGDLSTALDYFYKDLKISEELKMPLNIASSLANVAYILAQQGKINKAHDAGARSLKLAQEFGDPDQIAGSAAVLKTIFQKQNNYKAAFEMYELERKMVDSIHNISNQRESVKKQMQYTYEKKALADSILNVELTQRKELKHAQDIKEQKTYAVGGLIGFLLMLFLTIVSFRAFKNKQKANLIITEQKLEVENQKHLVEEKHKEITDSINYAERIQRSFIATKEILDENMNDYFVFFKPKDIVSGDFYWASKLKNGHFALATADSTGHGVPGAIMSLLNITSLEKAIETEIEPNIILNITRKIIIDRLKKDGSVDGGKDGMDCSLCVFDFKNKKLKISAANNPIWIVRASETIEIKPDKMPVGKHDKDSVSFTQHLVDLQKGDVIYTLTDGFPDQFGGHLGKKFMSKNLRELLSKNAHLAMQEQRTLLETTFKDWVGDLEQIDDVTLIGVRV